MTKHIVTWFLAGLFWLVISSAPVYSESDAFLDAFRRYQELSAEGSCREAPVFFVEALHQGVEMFGDDPATPSNIAKILLLYGLRDCAARHQTQGRYEEAETLYKQSLAMREKALGPEHPDVAQSLNNLAALYDAQGKYAEAEPLYQRSLAIREKALGPEHPDVAQSLETYAGLLRETGRNNEATRMETRAKAIRAKHAQVNPVE